MAYQPLLIAPFKEGERADVAPWLLPADGWEGMTDCFLENGVIKKRNGYVELGRFVEAQKTITGATNADPVVVTSAAHGFSDGDIVFISGVTGMTQLNGNTYVVSNKAANTFELKDLDGTDVNGTAFGVFSGTAIVSQFTTDSITGIHTYYDSSGDEILLIFNKDRMCKWNDSGSYFEPVTLVSHIIGYGDGSTLTFTVSAGALPWLPAEYLSGTVTVTGINTAGAAATLTDDGTATTANFTGDGTGTFVWATGATTANFTVAPGAGAAVYINYIYYGDLWSGADTNLFKNLNYDFGITNTTSSTTAYTNAAWFTNGVDEITYWDGTRIVVPLLDPVTDPGTYASSGKINGCRDFAVSKERLTLHGTYEGSTWYDQRVRWCQAAAPTKWYDLVAGQGDYTDISTGSEIMWSQNLRDVVVIAFQRGIWLQRYTGDPNLAFRFDQLTTDTTTAARNVNVAFDDFVVGVGPRGFYAVDGNTIRRIDEKLPEFVLNSIDQSYYSKMTGWRPYARDEVWFNYVPTVDEATVPDYPRRVLVWNTKDFTWSIFNQPFTGFGRHYTGGDKRWSDFADDVLWSSFNEETWNYWQWQANAPIPLAGTHDEYGLGGRVWILDRTAIDHWSEKIAGISAITEADPCKITTPYVHGLSTGDSVLFSGVGGMVELNDNIYTITVVDTTNFTLDNTNSIDYTTFTTGGDIKLAGSIDFELKSARWNPFNEQGKDTRLGWIDFYVNNDPDNEVSVDFYSDDGGAKYQTKTLSFDGIGDRTWKRLHSGVIGNTHSIRVYDTDSTGENVQIHALRLGVEPVGRGVL